MLVFVCVFFLSFFSLLFGFCGVLVVFVVSFFSPQAYISCDVIECFSSFRNSEVFGFTFLLKR